MDHNKLNLLVLDIESFFNPASGYTLRKMTPVEYILDHRFEAIMLGVQELGKAPNDPYVVDGPDIPAFLARHPPEQTCVVTFNALFDCSILAWRYNYVPALMLDAMGMARALRGHQLPSLSLQNVAAHLGLGAKGHTLTKVAGLGYKQIIAAGLYDELADYCRQDIKLTTGIFLKLYPEFPWAERRTMDLVIRCTVQPRFMLDENILNEHLRDTQAQKEKLLVEAGVASRDDLMSAAKFQTLLESRGVEIEYKVSPITGKETPAFAKTDEFMETLAEHDDPLVQALAAARLGHKSTLEETRCAKFLSISRLPWGGYHDGNGTNLMPMPLRYSGAHTHRLSGDFGLNVQNLTRGGKLRHALIAPPGHCVITADLAQIEARISAWICRVRNLVKQFANGKDVYASFASEVFGQPVTKKTPPHGPDGTSIMRFIGKQGVLGLGFGAGDKKFFHMVVKLARLHGIDLAPLNWSQELASKTVQTYRSTYNPMRAGWYTLQHAVVNVWSQPKALPFRFGPVVISYGKIALPNGLVLNYDRPHVDEDMEYCFFYGRKQHRLYGAKLLENIVQALARVIVMNAALRLANRGYHFALQGHDELVFIVQNEDAANARAVITAEMERRPSWAKDLPLAVEVSKPSRSYGEAK